MRKGNLTREQAIAQAGENIINQLDYVNCEPTNRVGYNGECQGDDFIEWSSSLKFTDSDGDTRILTAYYYTDNNDNQKMSENDGDGSCIDWEIEGYEVY